MAASGREIFLKFLSGEPLPRPPYVPLLRGITARIGGVPHRELTCDATVWANSLAKTAELLDLDGVVAGFHFSLLAEACGCTLDWVDDRPVVSPLADKPDPAPLRRGRLAGALEATRRIFEVAKCKRGCVAAVNGPLTLAGQLFQAQQAEEGLSELKPALVEVYEEFCKIRPDVVLFMESGPLVAAATAAGGAIPPALKRLYFTLKKIVSYYDIATAVYVQDYDPANVAALAALKMDIYILGPDREGRPPQPETQWALAENAMGIGLGLCPAGLEDCREILDGGGRVFREQPERRFFFTSLGPVRSGHDPQVQRELVKQIHQIRR
ncbi:hypothetical protein AAU61_09500 [Desulfocarbo indianensis]|nr:hypothetical protein AAU61_09500 [Desulfocarbo indianensis]